MKNKTDTLKPVFLDTMPEKLEEGHLYISRKYETAIHLCPCGCRNEIVTPTKKGWWKLTRDYDSITLSPSISNPTLPCKSHYWITNNEVVWAESPNEVLQ